MGQWGDGKKSPTSLLLLPTPILALTPCHRWLGCSQYPVDLTCELRQSLPNPQRFGVVIPSWNRGYNSGPASAKVVKLHGGESKEFHGVLKLVSVPLSTGHQLNAPVNRNSAQLLALPQYSYYRESQPSLGCGRNH